VTDTAYLRISRAVKISTVSQLWGYPITLGTSTVIGFAAIAHGAQWFLKDCFYSTSVWRPVVSQALVTSASRSFLQNWHSELLLRRWELNLKFIQHDEFS
jgi:hypothetical protein